jgi:hypothetical protein
VVKYRKIPPAAAANQIAENARIPPAADLQKNKSLYHRGNIYLSVLSTLFALLVHSIGHSTATDIASMQRPC